MPPGSTGYGNRAARHYCGAARDPDAALAGQFGDALKLVSETIRSWDTQTITDRVESAVGRDLQFIRVNGTLVGGLVGLLLHLLGYWI